MNQAPTFTKGGDVTVLEDAGAQAIPGWATAITSGPGDPSQALNFIVTNGNNPLFSAQPAVNALGALTFTTAPNKNGSAMVTISLHDDGGTANSGTDTSATQTFTINVTAVNDAPTFTKGPDISTAEETAPATHTVTNWATNFVPGPADESSQTVVDYTVTNNANNLFSTQPTINSGGTLSYRLAANRNGTATVSVSVTDSGGTANGGVNTSGIQTFTITITGVDHAPAAITDSATVIQGSGPTAIDVLANDFDPDGDTITIVGISQGAHGTTKIAADKLSVTYDPTGSYFGGDQFQYEITDGRMTAFGTVVVTVQKDTFAPVATKPKIVTTATTGTTATILLRWSGTDVGFGVKYYQLQESKNGGAFASVTVPVGAASVSRTVTNGSTYQYRVRGVDQVGNVGAYVLSAIYKPSEAPRTIGSDAFDAARLAGRPGRHLGTRDHAPERLRNRPPALAFDRRHRGVRSLPLPVGSCYTPGALTGQTGAYFALFSEIGILLLVTTLLERWPGTGWIDSRSVRCRSSCWSGSSAAPGSERAGSIG